jgi:energy-coupling factor transporter transmembrane protein EcfT
VKNSFESHARVIGRAFHCYSFTPNWFLSLYSCIINLLTEGHFQFPLSPCCPVIAFVLTPLPKRHIINPLNFLLIFCLLFVELRNWCFHNNNTIFNVSKMNKLFDKKHVHYGRYLRCTLVTLMMVRWLIKRKKYLHVLEIKWVKEMSKREKLKL